MERPVKAAADPTPSANPRILVVDDYEMIRRGLRSVLGAAVCGEAENGHQAIEKVVELRPNIVILDLMMPVMSGFDAARAIRAVAPETKIVVFSMHNGNSVKEEAFRAGADVFLDKATSGDEMLKVIGQLLATTGSEASIPSPSDGQGLTPPGRVGA